MFGLTANNLTAKAGKAKIAIIGVKSDRHHEKPVSFKELKIL